MSQDQVDSLSQSDAGGTLTNDSITDPSQKLTGSTPSDYARLMARPSVLSVANQDWQDVSLQRFQVPFHDIKLGASCVHRVTLHLAGSVLIERTREGRRDRQWSDRGCSNLVPAGVPVTRSFKGQADFIVAYVTPAIVNEVASDVFDLDPASVRLVESLAVTDATLERFGRLLLAEAEAGAVGTRLFVETVTRALALHLLRTYSAESQRASALPGAMVGWRLRRTIEYMQANLAENLPLAQLAAAAELSPSHFTRAFRAAVGEPPHRYLIRLRVEQARDLLEHTRLPIIEISLRCGFEQTTHFATMFRKTTGLSPRAYRAARCI